MVLLERRYDILSGHGAAATGAGQSKVRYAYLDDDPRTLHTNRHARDPEHIPGEVEHGQATVLCEKLARPGVFREGATQQQGPVPIDYGQDDEGNLGESTCRKLAWVKKEQTLETQAQLTKANRLKTSCCSRARSATNLLSAAIENFAWTSRRAVSVSLSCAVMVHDERQRPIPSFTALFVDNAAKLSKAQYSSLWGSIYTLQEPGRVFNDGAVRHCIYRS